MVDFMMGYMGLSFLNALDLAAILILDFGQHFLPFYPFRLCCVKASMEDINLGLLDTHKDSSSNILWIFSLFGFYSHRP